MKKLLVVIFLIVTIAACKQRTSQSAGEVTVKEPDNPADFTTMVWTDSTFRDMGTIKQGETLEIPFHFKNTGTRPLVIEDVHPGCGCTVAEKPTEPIAAGEEGVIKAKFSSSGMEGLQHKSLTVTANTSKSNTEQGKIHSLAFSVNVEKP
jgi:uncharacterized protein DUF1573